MLSLRLYLQFSTIFSNRSINQPIEYRVSYWVLGNLDIFRGLVFEEVSKFRADSQVDKNNKMVGTFPEISNSFVSFIILEHKFSHFKEIGVIWIEIDWSFQFIKCLRFDSCCFITLTKIQMMFWIWRISHFFDMLKRFSSLFITSDKQQRPRSCFEQFDSIQLILRPTSWYCHPLLVRHRLDWGYWGFQHYHFDRFKFRHGRTRQSFDTDLV